MPFCLKNKHVILVLESIKRGSAIYAALNALSDYNEPASIDVACGVDLQQMVYPFKIKFIGTTLEEQDNSSIEINFFEIDGKDAVVEKVLEKSC